MMTARQAEIMALLRQSLEDHFGETELADQEDATFLRLTPALFTDGTGLVYMEICLLDYTEEVMVAQVYSTMRPKPGLALAALREKLGEWNLKSLAGAYGIYEAQGQLYHKQSIALINDAAVDDQVDFLFAGICAVMDEMARRLPEAIALSSQEPSE